MAERSKAPDSRTISFLGKGTSGLQMEAWVQIPLLTSLLPACSLITYSIYNFISYYSLLYLYDFDVG